MTAMVWILVVLTHANAGGASQYGPFADRESCERVQTAVKNITYKLGDSFMHKTQCVEVKVYK
jgi:hypothetical protein